MERAALLCLDECAHTVSHINGGSSTSCVCKPGSRTHSHTHSYHSQRWMAVCVCVWRACECVCKRKHASVHTVMSAFAFAHELDKTDRYDA
jgi:hypothetical protein